MCLFIYWFDQQFNLTNFHFNLSYLDWSEDIFPPRLINPVLLFFQPDHTQNPKKPIGIFLSVLSHFFSPSSLGTNKLICSLCLRVFAQ